MMTKSRVFSAMIVLLAMAMASSSATMIFLFVRYSLKAGVVALAILGVFCLLAGRARPVETL